MSGQPQLFPDPPVTAEAARPQTTHALDISPPPLKTDTGPRSAPVWLQRLSLFVLVLFCVYLGILVMVLPWWTRLWDHNAFIQARPALSAILRNGAVRGIISGLGLLDIWIGISEAVNYRDFRG